MEVVVHMEAVARTPEEEAEATEVVVVVAGVTAVGDLIQAAEADMEEVVADAADVEEGTVAAAEEATGEEEAEEEALAVAEAAAGDRRNSTLGRSSSGASQNETLTAIHFNSTFRPLER